MLCLGTMNFGPQTSEQDSFKIMDRALDLGINFWDTAIVYGRERGEGITEQIIGRYFAQSGDRREKVVLATRVCGDMGKGDMENWPNTSRLSALPTRGVGEDSLASMPARPPRRPYLDRSRIMTRIAGWDQRCRAIRKCGYTVHCCTFRGGHDPDPWRDDLRLALS